MSELRTNRIVPRDGLPSGSAGGIIQVKQAIHYEYVQYNQNALTAGVLANGSTGNYSITITPTRSDSKILISFNWEPIVKIASTPGFVISIKILLASAEPFEEPRILILLILTLS